MNKLTSEGYRSTTISTTADKLFLLSEIEIFGNITYSVNGEGTQYDYYKVGNSKVKNYNGSANYWWQRSPYIGNYTSFCAVGNSGLADYISANDVYCISFAFCF